MSRFDSEIDATLERIASDACQDDQFFGVVNQLQESSKALAKGIWKCASSPLPNTFVESLRDVARGWRADAAKRTEENQIYLLDAVVEEVRYHSKERVEDSEKVERLSDIISHTLAYVGPTTSKDRLDRLAAIAASGAFVYFDRPIEETEEFLRISNFLYSTDVMVLRTIHGVQSGAIKGYIGSDQIINQLQMTWRNVLHSLKQAGIDDQTSKIACARLQSLGLLERLERNITANGLDENPCRLLDMGIRFLDYLLEHNAKTKVV